MNGLSDGKVYLHGTAQYLAAFDIVLLTETRAAHIEDGFLPQHSIAFIPASKDGRAGEGILVAVKKNAAYHVLDYGSDDSSLWVKVSFHDQRKPLILGCCYIPPAGSHSLQYKCLHQRMADIVARYTAAQADGNVLIAGDFNARVGRLMESEGAPARGCTDEVVTPHGRQLIRLCQDTHSLLCTGRAMGDESAAYSLRPTARGLGSRIDHVIAPEFLLQRISLCMVNPNRRESDHYPLEGTILQDLPPMASVECTGQPLLKRHWQSGLRVEYCEQLQTEACQAALQQAMHLATDGNLQAAFQKFDEGLCTAATAAGMLAKASGHYKSGRKHKPFFDAQCLALKRRVHRAHGPDRKDLEAEYHALVRRKKRAYKLDRLQTLIDEQYTDPRSFWKLLRAEYTDLPVSLQHVQAWDGYIQHVADCGCPSNLHLPTEAYPQQSPQAAGILNGDVTQEEIQVALQNLHNGRAKGSCGLPSELLRYAKLPSAKGKPDPPHILVPTLTALINHLFRQGAVPESINASLITPVYKKGDPFDTSNYRPIAVTEPIMRLYAGILNARLVQFTELEHLRADSQTGFRPELATTHQLMALQHFLSESHHARTPLYACFLDLKGAYDKVQRPLLWQALQQLGVHGRMLTAIQSLYNSSTLRVHVSGRAGPPQPSRTGLKQGCPLSPTLFGLFADGLHRYINVHCPTEGPTLDQDTKVPILGYADDFVLLADSPAGLQELIDAAATFCDMVGMIICTVKTKVVVFMPQPMPPVPWYCKGQSLQQVQEFKYLGLMFSAQGGMQTTFPGLKRKMTAAWALLRRQYGKLSCASSVGLLLRLYDVCVPPTGSYGCEVWGCYTFPAASAALRASLAQQHLQTLKHILGVRSTVNTHTLWQEVPVKRLEVVWLQRTVKFYNRLAAAPTNNLYRRIAVASSRSAVSRNLHNWAWSFCRSLQDIGYTFQLRADDLDPIVECTFDMKLKAKYDAVWKNLPSSPRTCPSQGASLCTYAAWFARPAHIHPKTIFRLPLSAGCVQTLLRFRMGCHNLPWDLGRRQGIGRLHRVCTLCAGGHPGDEQHAVFECPGLQDIRDKHQGLFGEHAATMLQFMWQDDIRGVAIFIQECLDRCYGANPDPEGGQASDQP